MRGRPPTPTSLRLIRGDPSHRPTKTAAKVELVAPSLPAPEFLSAVGRERWHRLVPVLSEAGLLSTIDTDLLAGYCEFVAEAERLKGLAVSAEDDGDIALAMKYRRAQRQSFDSALKAGREIGIGAVSRTRLATSAKPNETNPGAMIRKMLAGE